MKRLITLLLTLALAGCSNQPSDHPVFRYYPESPVLEEGYVSKFYHHFYPDNLDRSPITEVSYVLTRRTGAHEFITEQYNAGFRLVRERKYKLDGDTLRILYGKNIGYYDPTDTSYLQIVGDVMSVWGGETSAPFQLDFEENGTTYRYSEYQQSVYDSTMLDRPAKVFTNTWDYRDLSSDSVVNEGTSKSYYVQGIGFYGSENKGATYFQHRELMEQMPVEAFEELADHDEHRVAWIDPAKTISDDSDFRLCGHELRIADYYNSTPDGRYIHSKRAMLDTIYTNLNKELLFDQSGSLVFRFVVNCEGQAGRFIAEGYDFNYQPMAFRQETIDHLYGILRKLEAWRPVVLPDETRDAYFYINIKIENGEIIDILP